MKTNTDAVVGCDHEWIVANDEKVLWLPRDYRPALRQQYAIRKSIVAIADSKNRVFVIKLNLDHL